MYLKDSFTTFQRILLVFSLSATRAFRSIYVYVYIFMYVTTVNEKRRPEFERGQGGCMESWREEMKEEMM